MNMEILASDSMEGLEELARDRAEKGLKIRSMVNRQDGFATNGKEVYPKGKEVFVMAVRDRLPGQ
jgi:hypothetical protein